LSKICLPHLLCAICGVPFAQCPKKDRQENLAGKIQPAIKSEAVSKKSKSSQSWPRTKKLFTYFVLFLVVLGLAARPLRRGALFIRVIGAERFSFRSSFSLPR
jgi:hypothetical protein